MKNKISLLFVLLVLFTSCEEKIFLEKTPDIIYRDGVYVLDAAGHEFDKIILSREDNIIELVSCKENKAELFIFNNDNKGNYDLYMVNGIDTVFTGQTYIGIIDRNFLKITTLDVSQGDCFILEPTDEKPSIIDGGYGSLGGYYWQDGGNKTLVDRLIEENISDLKYIIETHHDEDHYGGLYDVISDTNFNFESYLTYGDDLPDFGDTLFFSNEVKGVMLHYGDLPGKEETEENDRSIAIKLIYKDFEMIFTGDIEVPAEEFILSEGLLSAGEDYEILKVAHHGSSSSSSDSFLSSVMPISSIISVGEGNPFNHPTTAVLDKLSSLPSDILRTDINSTIEIFTDGHSFQLSYNK